MNSSPDRTAFLTKARRSLHAAFLEKGMLSISAAGMPSIADKSSQAVAAVLLREMKSDAEGPRLKGQISGNEFEGLIACYLISTLSALGDFRPGTFEVHPKARIDKFAQYEHLADLAKHAKNHPELSASLGNDYIFKPDVVVSRAPWTDAELNRSHRLVDSEAATRTVARATQKSAPIMTASVSCKWTLRSDRAQGARTEALNLIRNRKGPLPRLVLVTCEPAPGRISSVALGTGDLDCVYHVALTELEKAIDLAGNANQRHQLKVLLDGDRLRDISDLPLDLVI